MNSLTLFRNLSAKGRWLAAATFYLVMLLHSSPGESAKRDAVAVLSYNILYDDPKRWGPDYVWAKRKAAVGQLLAAHPADVLGFQEMTAGQQADIATMLGEDFLVINPFEGQEKPPRIMNITFVRKTRFEVVARGKLELPSDVNERHGTWVTLKEIASGKVMHYLNLHLSVRSPEQRRDSFAAIGSFLNGLGQEPVVISGDFNSTRKLVAAQSAPLGLSFAKDESASPPPEVSGTKVNRKTQELEPKELDHILIRNISHVRSYSILDDRFDGRYPSDHLPVFTVLEP